MDSNNIRPVLLLCIRASQVYYRGQLQLHNINTQLSGLCIELSLRYFAVLLLPHRVHVPGLELLLIVRYSAEATVAQAPTFEKQKDIEVVGRI